MILTEVFGKVGDIPGMDSYHLETAMVKSDDLLKKIFRVKTDHGNEYGIRLEEDSPELENGSAFKISDHELLILSVIADEMIVITPVDINEMGVLAHMLGNLHKPVQVENGKIALLVDPVVVKTLEKHNIKFAIEKVELDKPLKYAEL